MEKLCGNEGRCWDATGSLFLRKFCVGVGVDIHVVFKEFWAQDVEICGVAERVKRFIRVFDCQLDNCRIIEASGMNGRIQMGTMSRALVRRKNQELGNPQSGW